MHATHAAAGPAVDHGWPSLLTGMPPDAPGAAPRPAANGCDSLMPADHCIGLACSWWRQQAAHAASQLPVDTHGSYLTPCLLVGCSARSDQFNKDKEVVLKRIVESFRVR